MSLVGTGTEGICLTATHSNAPNSPQTSKNERLKFCFSLKMSFWPGDSTSNEELIQNLKRTGVLHSKAVIDVLISTDRANYMAQIETPGGGESDAYQDVPHSIGYHQTISPPHTHGHALEMGSGYLTAYFGRLVERQGGHVFVLEIVPELVQFAKKNIERSDGELMDRGIVSLRCLNGWDGLASEGAFHYIYVGAAAETPPQELMGQLMDGGQLVLPLVEARYGQSLVKITRHGTNYSQRRLFGVFHAPLVRERERKMS